MKFCENTQKWVYFNIPNVSVLFYAPQIVRAAKQAHILAGMKTALSYHALIVSSLMIKHWFYSES